VSYQHLKQSTNSRIKMTTRSMNKWQAKRAEEERVVEEKLTECASVSDVQVKLESALRKVSRLEEEKRLEKQAVYDYKVNMQYKLDSALSKISMLEEHVKNGLDTQQYILNEHARQMRDLRNTHYISGEQRLRDYNAERTLQQQREKDEKTKIARANWEWEEAHSGRDYR